MNLRRALLSLGLLALLTPVEAYAQPLDDDWSLSRERPRRGTPTHAAARRVDTESPGQTGVRLYRAALADPGSDYAFEQLRAWELQQHGSLTDAIEHLRAELAQASAAARGTRQARASDERTKRELLARMLVGHGDVEQGLQLLAQSSESQPDEHSASLRARLLSSLGRHEQAGRQWLWLGERATASRQQRASWLREAAREQLAAGQASLALETVRQAQTLGGARFRLELRALELAAARESGRASELAEQLAKQGAYREVAELRLEQGDELGAISAYRTVLARMPTDLEARATLARLLAKAGQLEAAKRELLGLMRRAPGVPEYLLSWAELARAEGDREAALARLAAVARQKPRDRALHRALHALYVRWGELALAERELTELVTLEPSEPEHRLALADRALARGDRAAAVELLGKLAGRAESAAAQAELARVLGERDLLPEAIEHAQRAVAALPDAVDTRRLLASLLERGARPLDAERVWQELLLRADLSVATRSEAREHLVSLWRRAGTDRLHAAELEAKLREPAFEPEAARTLLWLYDRYPEQRARQKLLIERLLREVPDDLVALALLERAQLERRELSAALATRERALSLAASDPASALSASEAALGLARSYPLEDAAPSLVARALTVTARDGKLWRLAGEVYLRRQDFERARAAFEHARELDPRDFAALYALAEDARRRRDESRARTLLTAIVEGAEDEALVVDAAGLLLQVEGGEASLLRSLARATGAVQLRLLVQHYARSVLPAARDLLLEQASASERLRVSSTVEHALGPLLQALQGGAAVEREVALSLLAAAALPSTVLPLLALAERAELAPAERALALTGIGRAHDGRAASRLLALLERAGRQLRPFVLWALTRSSPALAEPVLAAALLDRDPNVRGVALLLVAERAQPSGSGSTPAQLDDRAPAVRAAALWLAARREPTRYAAELEALVLSVGPDSPLRHVALSVSAPGSPLLAGALFSDTSAGVLAARILTREPSATWTLPAPSWPLDFALYLERVVSLASEGTHEARFVASWPAIERAALARLAEPGALPAQVLASLEPAPSGGLLPSALLAAGACVPGELSSAFARALHPALARLMLEGSAAPASVRVRAQELLLASGGADRPELLAVLQRGPTVMQRELARSLAELSLLPPALRPYLEQLVARSSDWPTRMWAARALKVPADQLAHEPFALLRSAAVWGPPAHPLPTLCSKMNGVTN